MWHFRLIVPCDLHASLGRRVIKKSLGMRDPTAARLWAYTFRRHAGDRERRMAAKLGVTYELDKARSQRVAAKEKLEK